MSQIRTRLINSPDNDTSFDTSGLGWGEMVTDSPFLRNRLWILDGLALPENTSALCSSSSARSSQTSTWSSLAVNLYSYTSENSRAYGTGGAFWILSATPKQALIQKSATSSRQFPGWPNPLCFHRSPSMSSCQSGPDGNVDTIGRNSWSWRKLFAETPKAVSLRASSALARPTFIRSSPGASSNAKKRALASSSRTSLKS